MISFLLGLAGALAAIGWHLADLDRLWELYALDLRFQHASSAQPPEDILHVDIDDRSMDEIGRWPWPRQTQGEIVAVLHECGASAVVLDIILPEPQPLRYVSQADAVYGADESKMLHQLPPKAVLDDAKLAQVIRRCGNVLMPMDVDFTRKDRPPIFQPLIALLAKTPDMTAEQAAIQLRRNKDEVQAAIDLARAEAVSARVAEILTASPEAAFRAVLRRVLPDLPANRASRERGLVEKAYLRQRAVQALAGFTIPGGQVAGGRIDDASLRPPLVPFARLICGSGFVTFRPDPDKSIRRIPLLARSEGLVYLQFALAVAVQELERKHGGPCRIKADGDSVTLSCAGRTLRSIPVDRRGSMLIHWAQGTWPPKAGPSDRSRVSAASVAWLSQERRRSQRLKAHIQARRLEVVNMRKQGPDKQLDTMLKSVNDAFREFEQAHQDYVAMERWMLKAVLYDPPALARLAGADGPQPAELKLGRKLDELERQELASENRLVEASGQFIACIRQGDRLDAYLGKPAGAADAQAQAEFKARKDEALAVFDTIASLAADMDRTEANIVRLKEELASIVKGKICMVGSTSTGAADFVPCPLGARTPGVVVHSNIIGTILDERFIHEAHWALNVLVILMAGAAVSLVAAYRPVVQAAAGACVLAGAYAAINGFVVFGMWSVWLVGVAPLVAILASFLTVTAYRQLTEERGKRELKAMLVQTLSPEVVEEVLKDPSLLSPGGQKNALSCMFSDLTGFTPLSEALGPPQTVRLLNRYFDGATEAIANRWGGWVNKFLGDGIFAIFGVPVRAERHAARAVEAAIDCQKAVERLNAELARESGLDVQLSVRIGITTGEAMVGNCGSTTKADLTAIGDHVNQASRLEAANKSFGTRIIVARETWEACDRQGLLARPLGRIFIVGVSEAVRVWHVLGRVETLGEDLRGPLDDFARAMDLFIEQDFTGAMGMLEEVQRAMPNDKAGEYYMDLCRQCAARPVGDETWRAAHKTKGVARVAMPWQDVNPNEHTK